MEHNPVPLLEMSKMTTMPAPWASTDEGECWIWGDYFFLLLREPPTLAELFATTDGNIKRGNLSYPLALTGFYKADKNPFLRPDNQPTSRPVIALTIEQADFAAANEKVGLSQEQMKAAGMGDDGKGPMMAAVFFQGVLRDSSGLSMFLNGPGRSNLGVYEGNRSRDTMRKHLFDLVPKFLPVTGEPIRIGVLKDALGHPSTGLPSDFMDGNIPVFKSKTDSQSAKQGCFAQAIILASLLGTLAYGVSAVTT